MLFVSIILLPVLTGCSDNGGIIPADNSPCSGDKEYILNLSGGPDAPVLYASTGNGLTDAYIYWTENEGAYYEVQECDCPYFTTIIYTYYIYQDSFLYGIKEGYFYRVRAIAGSGITGWSNVVVGSYGGWL